MGISSLRLATIVLLPAFFVPSGAAGTQTVPASLDLEACLAADSAFSADPSLPRPIEPMPNAGSPGQTPPMPNAWSLGQIPPMPNAGSLDRRPPRPAVADRNEMDAAIEREYPPTLRNAGIGGGTFLGIFIDDVGAPRAARVIESSGFPELDEAARRVGCSTRFTPRTHANDMPFSAWYGLPIRFQTR